MKIALALLLLTALSAASQVSVDAPPARGSKIPPPPHHKVKRAACGSTRSVLTADQQKSTIAAHNLFRAREEAKNMLKTEWNDDVASVAQAWADQCKGYFGMLYDCDGNRVGQNLWIETSEQGYPEFNITAVAERWWSAKKDYTHSTGACTPGKLCGLYTQLVWARSSGVGCGFAHCPSMKVDGVTKKNCLYVVCDYTPPGNLPGDPVYYNGAPCSNCHFEGTGAGYKCENNLCTPCTPATDSTCKCGANPGCVNGAWSTSTCTCTCNKGFHGLKCEKPCNCDDRIEQCREYIVYCPDPDYRDFMSENCSTTCKFPCKLPAVCSASAVCPA